MPLYDRDNPLSAEASALWHLADLLAECTHWQTLCEQPSKAAARSKIHIGIHDSPWDGDTFSRQELEEAFCEAHLMWPLQGTRTVMQSDGSPTPEEGGDFTLTIRRLVRESEVTDLAEDGGLDLWFLDIVAALETELITDAETRECPRLTAIQRIVGPAAGEWDEGEAQGEYLWVQYSIEWGDVIED